MWYVGEGEVIGNRKIEGWWGDGDGLRGSVGVVGRSRVKMRLGGERWVWG